MSGRSLRLVVGDDERDTVTTLAAILADEGHYVMPVYSGPGVLAEVKRVVPDAVIVDIDMPDISGLSVARELRRIYGDLSPLLIAISGKFVGETDRMLSELAGFHHFLQKPCAPSALLELLAPLASRAPRPAPDFSATVTRVPEL
ncbi:MAG TPA: response regulator [Burkholderiales bacterium]|nr:response regulator [Burkholderiales bacterium]